MPGDRVAAATHSPLRRWRRARASKHRVRVGPTILVLLVAACVLQPLLSPFAPDATVSPPLQGPSASHWLGTDQLGRDLATRLFTAGRLDIALAFVGVAVSWVVGTLLGITVVIGRPRWPEWLMERAIDGLLAFPFVLFALTLVLAFGADWSVGPLPPGAPATLLAIWFINWALYARLARAETRALVSSDFVVAAKTLGYSPLRIVTRHIMPLVARTTVTVATGDMLLVIGVVAALPFLGAGVQPPNPEWGVMMYEGRGFLQQTPLLVLAPTLLIVVFGIGVTLTVDRRLDRGSLRDLVVVGIPPELDQKASHG